ncbi:hypothetical protein [Rivularia sp. UHCC 0363]|nr:hypothetical protein [Rivularia sp. UHCC 0363]MEA5593385.1 hypothetical protein [Rivularia sp. UHCC 0363]
MSNAKAQARSLLKMNSNDFYKEIAQAMAKQVSLGRRKYEF